jgi:hypothetical protein
MVVGPRRERLVSDYVYGKECVREHVGHWEIDEHRRTVVGDDVWTLVISSIRAAVPTGVPLDETCVFFHNASGTRRFSNVVGPFTAHDDTVRRMKNILCVAQEYGYDVAWWDVPW